LGDACCSVWAIRAAEKNWAGIRECVYICYYFYNIRGVHVKFENVPQKTEVKINNKKSPIFSSLSKFDSSLLFCVGKRTKEAHD
jgi:hypothetical protein